MGDARHGVIDRAPARELRRFACTQGATAVKKVLQGEGMPARIGSCDPRIINGDSTLHHGAGIGYFSRDGAVRTLVGVTVAVDAAVEAHAYDGIRPTKTSSADGSG